MKKKIPNILSNQRQVVSNFLDRNEGLIIGDTEDVLDIKNQYLIETYKLLGIQRKIEKLNLAYGTVTADTVDGYDDFHYYPFVEIKKKGSGFRLMGFGHRVYKNYDPRATLIKASCDKLLAKIDRCDPLFDIAQQLEEVARGDDYFIERKLYPNVEFYSGVIYRAMGIPEQMFTVLFAMGRLPGWIAHWMEMHQSPTKKICRPRQVYSGETLREFVPLDQR